MRHPNDYTMELNRNVVNTELDNTVANINNRA